MTDLQSLYIEEGRSTEDKTNQNIGPCKKGYTVAVGNRASNL